MNIEMNRSESGSSLELPPSAPSSSSGRSRPISSSASGIAPLTPLSPAQSLWSPNGARRRNGRIFRSTRIDPAAYKDRTPWHETPAGKSTLRRTRWTCVGVTMIGVLSAAALVVTGYLSVPKHEYCLVLDEQFNGNSLDTSIWSHEVQVGGFGNKEFEMTTTSSNNSFVEDGNLYIVPTLTNETYGNAAILDGYTLNLTADGTCTGSTSQQCVAYSNGTAGNFSVIPPIMSARLTTKLSKSIKYGKVEVKARMPTGDWIWPAIWMMPKDEVYGAWPASGEIDILETKGNIPKHEWDTDVNVAQSTLHWGLDSTTDRYKWTTGWKKLKRHYLNSAYYMSPLFRFFALFSLLASQAVALFSQGTISDRDYQLTYTGYNDTTAFCTAFRAECVDYVGALNYHHNLDCVVSQTGPTIHVWCGGVEKDASGDTGSGPAVDFTHLVCPAMEGCSVKKEPEEPVEKYAGGSSAAAFAASTPSSTTVAVASSSATSIAADKAKTTSVTTTTEEEEVLDTPPTDSSLLTSIPSTATWATFASQASLAAAPTLEHLSAAASVKTGALNAAATGGEGADAESGAGIQATRGGEVIVVAAVAAVVGGFFL